MDTEIYEIPRKLEALEFSNFLHAVARACTPILLKANPNISKYRAEDIAYWYLSKMPATLMTYFEIGKDEYWTAQTVMPKFRTDPLKDY